MKKTILILILILIILGGYVWYKMYYSISPAQRHLMNEIKRDKKIAKDNVLANIKSLRESIDTKELGTGEDLSISELAMAKDKRAVPILCEILTQYTEPVEKPEDRASGGTMDGADHVRMEASDALCNIGDKSAMPALIKAAFEDKHKEVRKSAFFAIRCIEQKESLNILKKGLNDPDEDVRKFVKQVIESLK
jgi:HEAT repeat protein